MIKHIRNLLFICILGLSPSIMAQGRMNNIVNIEWCTTQLKLQLKDRESVRKKMKKAAPSLSEEDINEFILDTERRFKVSCAEHAKAKTTIREFKRNLKYMYENGSKAFDPTGENL